MKPYSLKQELKWLAIQFLLKGVRLHNLPIEQAIKTAQSVLSYEYKFPERQQAAQFLLQLAQQHDLPVEQAIEAAKSVYQSSPASSEEKQQATQFLLQLA